MHLVGNNSSMQPTQLWSVGKSIFFMMCIYKHCFPPMLLVLAMKCYTKMPCPLPHNHYCCLLSSPICLPHLLICTCPISSPIACLPSSVLCWCLLRFFFIFAICYFLYKPQQIIVVISVGLLLLQNKITWCLLMIFVCYVLGYNCVLLTLMLMLSAILSAVT